MRPGSSLHRLLRQVYYRLAFWLVQRKVRGHGNVLRTRGAFLKHVRFEILGDRNQIQIAPGAFLHNVTFHILGNDHRISIAPNCAINRGGLIWFDEEGGALTIEEGTTIEEAHLAVTEKGSRMTLGRDCMLAYDIDLRTGDSHGLFDAATGERLNPARDVVLGEHVWVAAHVSILKGVHIAPGCVVATGSVVSASCETPGSVLAGNPARVIKQGIRWSRQRHSML